MEFDAIAAYKKKVEEIKMTKVDFIHQMQTDDETIDDPRAERMWTHFESQLESGGVEFLENGTMKFSLPVTHYLAPYMPTSVSDTIESSFMAARRLYLRAPFRYRRRLEQRVDHFVESGAVYATLAVLLTAVVVDVGMSAWRSKETAAGDTTDDGAA